jgi:hypothetical protein
MNSMNDLENPTERELARRLGDLAETTTVSPDAWDRLAARTVASPSVSGAPAPGFARRHVRPLLAAAAAVVMVVGVGVAMALGADDEPDLGTGGHSDRTTTTTSRPPPDRRPTSTTTAPSTTVPGADSPTGGASPDAGTPPSAESTEGGSSEAGGPSGPGGTESSESERAAPTRAAPTMTLRSSEYTVEIIADSEPGMFFRRTDDVGNDIAGPDGYGAASRSGWSGQSGPRCLTSGGGTMTYPDAGPHAFTYGLVGSEISRVEVVMPNGQTATASIGPGVGGGFRAWLVERPAGDTVQDIRGLDAAGNVVASIGHRSSDDFGYSTATC